MRKRILKILNLKPGESKYISDLLVVQLFIGLANSYINIVAFTLFLKSFSLQKLPQAYIIIAIVLLILNLFYEKLERSLSPIGLLKWIVGFSAFVLFFIWTGLFIWNAYLSIFILVIWSTISYMIMGYAYWGLVSSLFNIRESKRVFSIVGAGDLPAKLIGYLSAPLFIALIGVNNLISLSIVSLVTALLVFNRLTRKKKWEKFRIKGDHSHHHVPAATVHGSKKKLVGYFFKNELIFAISLLSLISYNVFNLVDFTFLSQVKLHYEDTGSLAAFIAIFFAIGRLAAIILKLVFTSRLIGKLGIISCLFITPIALFTFAVIFLLSDTPESYNVYLFGMMALLTEVLRSTMQEPVFFILFQPLREHLRLKGHIISKGYMLPPSLIIVGLTLFLLYESGYTISILFIIKLLLLNLVIWAGVIFFIRKAYLKTLHDSIAKGVFSSDEVYLYDQQSINILLDKLKTGKKSEIVYALKLLERAKYSGFGQLVQEQLFAKDKELRLYALDRLSASGTVNVELLKDLLETEPDAEVRQKLVSILCRIDPDFLQMMSDGLAQKEYGIRKAVIIALFNQREFTRLHQAGSEINNLMYSANPHERELAVNIISEVKHVRFAEVLRNLINDPDLRVRRATIITICKLKMNQLLLPVIELLGDSSGKYLALQGLIHYGDELFADINQFEAGAIEPHYPEIVRIAAKVKGLNSIRFLENTLGKFPSLNPILIHALALKDYEVADKHKLEQFEELLKTYLQLAVEKVDDYYRAAEYREDGLLDRALDNEIKNDLITSLELCRMIYKKTEIKSILSLIEFDKKEKLLNAVEMIELVLPKKIARKLNQLFDYILDSTFNRKALPAEDVHFLFNRILYSEAAFFNSWTKAICIYSSWKNNDKKYLTNLKSKPPETNESIMSETTEFVLQGIK